MTRDELKAANLKLCDGLQNLIDSLAGFTDGEEPPTTTELIVLRAQAQRILYGEPEHAKTNGLALHVADETRWRAYCGAHGLGDKAGIGDVTKWQYDALLGLDDFALSVRGLERVKKQKAVETGEKMLPASKPLRKPREAKPAKAK